MKKHFKKIHKDVTDLATAVAAKKWDEFTEDDLDLLAEALNILEDTYELLYSEVFEESEHDCRTICKGTSDQL
jgi:hypothetical protein